MSTVYTMYRFKEIIMTLQIGAKDARAKFAELLGRVGFGREEIVIERSGKPMAALIPMDVYQQMVAEREARFAVAERIQSKQPVLPPEQVEADVEAVIEQVRADRAARRD
jgi:prevent-host-death family protein